MAWAWHGKFESDTAALCKSNGERPLAARHGRGTAWARHVMCESTFRVGKLQLRKYLWTNKERNDRAHFKDVILCLLMNYCKVGTVCLKKTYEGVKVELHTFLARWRGMVGFTLGHLTPGATRTM